MLKQVISFIILLVFTVFVVGCHCDIVTTKALKKMENKVVYIERLETEVENVGVVIRDVLQKELLRKNVVMCDNEEDATLIITGAAFFTNRATGEAGLLGSKSFSSQAIESVSVKVQDKQGNILCSASYDNSERYTASRLGKELGSMLADRLK